MHYLENKVLYIVDARCNHEVRWFVVYSTTHLQPKTMTLG